MELNDFSVIDQYFRDAVKQIDELEKTLSKYGYKAKPDPEYEAIKRKVLKDE